MAKKQAIDAGVDIDIHPLSFEEAYQLLETIVAQLEQGDLPLDQSLALHERGQKLAEHCAHKLDEAELKVKEI
jgi:exodeoxyribonuclease VII small subunit